MSTTLIIIQIVSGIIFGITLLSKNRLERTLLKDYQKTLLHLLRVFVFTIFTYTLSLFFLDFKGFLQLEEFPINEFLGYSIAIILFVGTLFSIIYFNYIIDAFPFSEKVLYFEENNMKFFLVKRLRKNEMILSNTAKINDFSDLIIIKKSDLRYKIIKTFINKKFYFKRSRELVGKNSETIINNNKLSKSEIAKNLNISKILLNNILKGGYIYLDTYLIEKLAEELSTKKEELLKGELKKTS